MKCSVTLHLLQPGKDLSESLVLGYAEQMEDLSLVLVKTGLVKTNMLCFCEML